MTVSSQKRPHAQHASITVRKDSPSHNRDSTQCKYHDSISVYWPCPACQRDLTRSKGVKNHLDTEPGKCRFAEPFKLPDDHDPEGKTVPAWWNPLPKPGEGQASASGGRQGARARPPRPRSFGNVDPTSGASSYDMLRDAPERGNTPSASSSEAPQVAARRGRLQGVPPPPDAVDEGDRLRRATRNPLASTGSGAPRLPDWTRFDIQHSLQSLSSHESHVVKKGTPKTASAMVSCEGAKDEANPRKGGA